MLSYKECYERLNKTIKAKAGIYKLRDGKASYLALRIAGSDVVYVSLLREQQRIDGALKTLLNPEYYEYVEKIETKSHIYIIRESNNVKINVPKLQRIMYAQGYLK